MKIILDENRFNFTEIRLANRAFPAFQFSDTASASGGMFAWSQKCIFCVLAANEAQGVILIVAICKHKKLGI
jgi:hypothetical protein